jgi:hypothetical protein
MSEVKIAQRLSNNSNQVRNLIIKRAKSTKKNLAPKFLFILVSTEVFISEAGIQVTISNYLPLPPRLCGYDRLSKDTRSGFQNQMRFYARSKAVSFVWNFKSQPQHIPSKSERSLFICCDLRPETRFLKSSICEFPSQIAKHNKGRYKDFLFTMKGILFGDATHRMNQRRWEEFF